MTCFRALVTAFAGLAGFASFVEAQSNVSVFGPGTISKAESNVFRGQFSPDGQEFWFFRKVREGAEDYRIFVSRRSAGSWTEPVQISFGGPNESEMYPALSPDGQRLVFTSYRAVAGDTSDHPNANLWFVERRGDGWSEPVLMRGASTLDHYESQPWFDSSGALRFSSTTPDWRRQEKRQVPAGADLATARWQADPILAPWRNWRSDHEVRHGNPSPDGSLMVLEVAPIDAQGRAGTTDLWISARQGAQWSEPRRLGESVNSPGFEAFVVFTPDGETMLFAREFRQYYQVPVAELRQAAGARPAARP
jgi:hypothetical protein